MLEREIKKYLDDQVAKRGGETRQVEWVGQVGAPDKMVLLGGKIAFVETKKPGEVPRATQLKEHAKLRKLGGAFVVVIDSKITVDKLMYAMYDQYVTPAASDDI
jgi:hypothetical protein